MKWKKYNSMTKEQKEEYNYRFRDNPYVYSTKGLLYSFSLSIAVINVFIFGIYFVITNESMEHLKNEALNLLISVTSLWSAVMVGVVVYYVYAIISMISNFIKEYRWLKRNNIQ